MRTVNFDDMPDEDGTEPQVQPAASPAASPAAPAAAATPASPAAAVSDNVMLPATADLSAVDKAMAAATADLVAAVVADPHEMLTFHTLTGDGTGEALPALPDDAYPPDAVPLLGTVELPAKPSRSIYEAEHAMTSPSKSLGECVEIVLRNFTRLTPGQVEALHGVLLELGADLDADDEAGGLYGPEFDMTAFIRRMVQTTKTIERQLYRPTEDGMAPAFPAQQLGAITNANKNLMSLIAKNHDKVMGWERQRHIEAAHMAAARDLPVDIQDKYLARLQAELEQRGL